MRVRTTLLALFLSYFVAATAYAVVFVTPTNSATAAFDVSALSPGDITGFGYSCTTSCSLTPGSADELIAPGGEALFNFGATPGGDEFGTYSFESLFSDPINNLSVTFGNAAQFIPVGALSTVYVTLAYVDDMFGVDTISLRFRAQGGVDETLRSNANGLDTTPPIRQIPLPASLPLFLAGLAGLAFAWRARRRPNAAV